MTSAKVVEIQAIREQVLARRSAEAQAAEARDPSGDIATRFVLECFRANELGDGMLFAESNRNDFLYLETLCEWLCWNGVHWQRDTLRRRKPAVENVVDLYLREADAMGKQMLEAQAVGDKAKFREIKSLRDEIYKRVKKLRSVSGRESCLEMSTTCPGALNIRGDDMDQEPWKLACANGVIDLQTGVLREGYQEDRIFRASPVTWQGIDAPCPAWEQFIDEIFEGNRPVIAFLQRLLGYCLTGLHTEHILPIFVGQGRNGKTTLFETVMKCMGELAGPIRSEMILDQGQPRSADAPSSALMDLQGMRLVLGSETDKNQKFSMTRVKLLSGGDTLTGRYPYEKHNRSFEPTHKLILYTNHLPHAIANDFAFWERLLVIHLRLAFVNRKPVAENERQQNPELPNLLAQEMPGILAWLVRGCLLYQQVGLAPPPEVKTAVRDFQRDEDYLADFFEECCELSPEYEVKATDLYDRFEEWFLKNISSNKNKVPKQRSFGQDVGKRFNRWKSEGIMKYKGLRLLPKPQA